MEWEGKWHKFFIFKLLFGASKRWNLSEALQKSVKIKIMSFLIQLITLGWLGQDRLLKFYLLELS